LKAALGPWEERGIWSNRIEARSINYEMREQLLDALRNV
jgi:hypothetical protein